MEIRYRTQFPSLLREMGLLESAVEVGVYRGEFAGHMLAHWPGRYYMVDSWWTKDAIAHKKFVYSMVGAVVECMRISRPYEDRAFILRMTSIEAARIFPESSLDFVYIDACHSYQSVSQDIAAWLPKVRPGGVLAGHDYLRVDPDNMTEDQGHRLNDKDVMLMQYVHAVGKVVPVGPYGANAAVDEFVEATGVELHLTEEQMFRSWWVQVPE